MIRINLSPEPQWLDLGHGVRLLLLPLTTALMVATRSDPAVQALDADASNDTRAAVFAAALARRAIVDWEGVGDESGTVIAVSPEGIDALLSLWPIFEAFTRSARSSSAAGSARPFPATGWNTIAAFWCWTPSR